MTALIVDINKKRDKIFTSLVNYNKVLSKKQKQLQIAAAEEILENQEWILKQLKDVQVREVKFKGKKIRSIQPRLFKEINAHVSRLKTKLENEGWICDSLHLLPVAITNGEWILWINGTHRKIALHEKFGFDQSNAIVINLDSDLSVDEFINEYNTELHIYGSILNPDPDEREGMKEEDYIWQAKCTFINRMEKKYGDIDTALEKLHKEAWVLEELTRSTKHFLKVRKELGHWNKTEKQTATEIKKIVTALHKEELFDENRTVFNLSPKEITKLNNKLKKQQQFINTDFSLYTKKSMNELLRLAYRALIRSRKSVCVVDIQAGTKAELVEQRKEAWAKYIEGLCRYIAMTYNISYETSLYNNASQSEKLEFRQQIVDKAFDNVQLTHFTTKLSKEREGGKAIVPVKKILSEKYRNEIQDHWFKVFVSEDSNPYDLQHWLDTVLAHG